MSISAEPLISILMPNYNYGRFLSKAIDGILAQTYKNYELIIIDDASTDDSAEIIRDYARRDSRIKPFLNEKNLGVVANFNFGVGKIRGELLYMASSDDYICRDDFFKDVVDAFSFHPEMGMFFGVAEVFKDDTGEKEVLMGASPHNGYFSSHDFLEAFLGGGVIYHGGTIICRVDEFIKYGGYNPQLKALTDYYVNCAIGSNCGAYYSPQTYIRIRSSGAAFSSHVSNSGIDEWMLFEKLLRQNTPASLEKEDLFSKYRLHIAKLMVVGAMKDHRQIASDGVTQVLNASTECYYENMAKGRDVAVEQCGYRVQLLYRQLGVELPLDFTVGLIDHVLCTFHEQVDLVKNP